MQPTATLPEASPSSRPSNTKSSLNPSEASVPAVSDLLLRLTVAVERLASQFDALMSDLEKYVVWLTAGKH